MAEYKDHSSILIADVDCTAEGKPLCDVSGVKGFPTIKYGDPNSLEDYEGGRDFKSLQKFANENLGPRCGPANLDLCDAAKKQQIEEFMKLSLSDLQTKIDEGNAKIAQADKDVDELLKKLQAQYNEGQKKNEETKKEIKESGLGLMKAVQAHVKKTKSEL